VDKTGEKPEEHEKKQRENPEWAHVSPQIQAPPLGRCFPFFLHNIFVTALDMARKAHSHLLRNEFNCSEAFFCECCWKTGLGSKIKKVNF
jgi:hypothetical protein